MKYFITVFVILLAACLNEEVPRGVHSTNSPTCNFANPTNHPIKVVNIKLSGSQNYMGVNNFRFYKQTHSVLPKLAPQFRGMVAGSDILTNGGNKDGLIADFSKAFDLGKDEEIILSFYEENRPTDLKTECVIDWND